MVTGGGRARIVALALTAGVFLQGQGGPPQKTIPLPPVVTAPPPISPLDGRVGGLDAATYARLAEIARTVPMGENEARAISALVTADGTIGPAERELLDELSRPDFAAILVSAPGGGSERPLVIYPFCCKNRELLIDTIEPPVDFAGAWDSGAEGWAAIIAEYGKGGYRASRAETFVKTRLDDAWQRSTAANLYKPFGDEVRRLYSQTMTLDEAAERRLGHQLVHNAAARLDIERNDAIGDFFYSWLTPAATGS